MKKQNLQNDSQAGGRHPKVRSRLILHSLLRYKERRLHPNKKLLNDSPMPHPLYEFGGNIITNI